MVSDRIEKSKIRDECSLYVLVYQWLLPFNVFRLSSKNRYKYSTQSDLSLDSPSLHVRMGYPNLTSIVRQTTEAYEGPFP